MNSAELSDIKKTGFSQSLSCTRNQMNLPASGKGGHLPVNKSIRLDFMGLTPENRNEKLAKAVRALSRQLGVPVDITAKSGGKGEGFCFKAQEELFARWEAFFDGLTRGAYALTTVWLGLPTASVVSKAGELEWKGKILYSPETGMPIKRADFDRFAEALRRFIDRKVADAGRRMVLQATALGKILDRMMRAGETDAAGKGLSGLKYKGKTFDWISDSTKNMGKVLGDSLTRQELARIEVASQSAANRVTHASEDMKAAIRQTVIDGIKNRKGKSQISQDLYDRVTGENRDFRRIADTEIQNATNTAYLKEEVFQSGGGGKVYFRRKEVLDGCTCGYCRKMDGKIAVWSDVPVPGGVRDEIADLAIWEGKEWDGKRLESVADAPTGAFHPWCRGTWLRYYPGQDIRKKK